MYQLFYITDGVLLYGLAGRDVHLAISYDPSVLLGAEGAISSKPGSDSDDPKDLEKIVLIEQQIYKLVFSKFMGYDIQWIEWRKFNTDAPSSKKNPADPTRIEAMALSRARRVRKRLAKNKRHPDEFGRNSKFTLFISDMSGFMLSEIWKKNRIPHKHSGSSHKVGSGSFW